MRIKYCPKRFLKNILHRFRKNHFAIGWIVFMSCSQKLMSLQVDSYSNFLVQDKSGQRIFLRFFFGGGVFICNFTMFLEYSNNLLWAIKGFCYLVEETY